jgi:peptidoglycan hydrolase-like protein with peptidoglycan-binding domain
MHKSTLSAVLAAALAIPGAAFAGGSTSPIDDVPPNAQPGECYARIVIPAQYTNEAETYVAEDGYDKIEVSEAAFQAGSQDYVAKEASRRFEVRQPSYRVVSEEVVVRPGYERLVVEPARYETVTETVQITAPRQVWKRGSGLSSITRQDPTTGDIYCLVTEPGQTQTIQRRVLRQPETVRRIAVPPQTTTIQRQVVADPGEVREVPIPEERRTFGTQTLVQPAGQRAVPVAPRQGTFNKRVLVSPERFEWVPVLCDTNATPDAIRRIQQGLASAGYYRGPIDGIWGSGTNDALVRFQRERNLPYAGYVTVQTLDALCVGTVQQSTPRDYQPSRFEAPAPRAAPHPAPPAQDELMGAPTSAPVAQAAPHPAPVAREGRTYSVQRQYGSGSSLLGGFAASGAAAAEAGRTIAAQPAPQPPAPVVTTPAPTITRTAPPVPASTNVWGRSSAPQAQVQAAPAPQAAPATAPASAARNDGRRLTWSGKTN